MRDPYPQERRTMDPLKTRSLFAAAIAAVTLGGATAAQAQYRIDTGNARDANNRVGSGGYNTPPQDPYAQRFTGGNLIVTGNVTGGQGFRGPVGYVDPREFRGGLGSRDIESFVRNSSGISTNGTPSYNASVVRPFFGTGSTVQAPPNFRRDIQNQGFVPADIVPSSAVLPVDGRLDKGGVTRDVPAQALQSGVNVAGSGAANAAFGPDALGGGPGIFSPAGASLSLMRQGDARGTRLSEYTLLARPGEDPLARPQPNDAEQQPTPRIDPAQAAQAAGGERDTERQDRVGTGVPAAGGAERLSTGATPVDPRVDAAAAGPLGSTGQGSTVQSLNRDPRRTNRQYNELRQRFEAIEAFRNRPGAAAAEQAREVNREVLDRQQRERQAQQDQQQQPNPARPGGAQQQDPMRPATPAPRADGGVPATPEPAPEPAARPAERPVPMVVRSFADGIEDRRLRDTLRQAEQLMKERRFASAIDQFDRAEALAPDDPMVLVGRATAELGASYYRLAEVNLRQAFAGEPALLTARYDLGSLLTEERLAVLSRELAQLANDNRTDAGPLLLLAFIDHNTGNEPRAITTLRRAAERAGGKDEVVTRMLEAWTAQAPDAGGEGK